jgi:hypothetical protein
MIKTWTLAILSLSLLLLTILKEFESRKLTPFFPRENYLILKQFKIAKNRLEIKEVELLEVWESIITGRSAPVSKWIKDQYSKLGLKHLFTPSGFHLSALTAPLFYFFKNNKFQLFFLGTLAFMSIFTNAPSALKRMSLIKLSQKYWGIKTGFVFALIMDVLMADRNVSLTSFTYSFLFLGMIYSGENKFWILLLFFMGQAIISFTQEILISPLILILSPLLNFLFSIAIPILFLLAWPLKEWQLEWGLCILKVLQKIVIASAGLIEKFPQIFPNLILLLMLVGIFLAHRRLIIICLMFNSHALNLDLQKYPHFSSYEFQPRSSSEGRCKIELIKGFWWERCSPKRRGSYNKGLKKLSYH